MASESLAAYYYQQKMYWYGQYNTYNEKNNKLKTQKRDLTTYLRTLNSLSKNIGNTHDSLESAEKKYAAGGYIDGDQTLDHGTLKKLYTLLETDKQVADSIVTRVTADIRDMEIAIGQNNTLITNCWNNYQYYAQLEYEAYL